MQNRLISTMNLKTKAILFLLALLLPFCTVLVISLTALWQRTHAVLDNELTKAGRHPEAYQCRGSDL